jgi:DNA-binding transcriptional ArsR family regulator
VAVLEQAGLVTKERSGRTQLVRGNPATVRRASALLEQYEALWVERAERMRDILTTG